MIEGRDTGLEVFGDDFLGNVRQPISQLHSCWCQYIRDTSVHFLKGTDQERRVFAEGAVGEDLNDVIVNLSQ